MPFIQEMSFITLAIVVVIGVAIGSFLNVVLLRFRSRSLFGEGDSMCLSCGARLKLLDLIPVLSYIGLRGKCRSCGSKFSGRYALVEIVTGALFGAMYAMYGVTLQMIIMCGIMIFLILMSFYDQDHFMIPDEFSIPFNILALLSIFVRGDEFIFTFLSTQNISSMATQTAGYTSTYLTPASHLLNHLFAGIIACSFFFLIWYVTKGRAMGFADGIIALGIGFVLGMPAIFTALVMAFWIGTIVSIGIVIFQKGIKKLSRRTRKKVERFVLGAGQHSQLGMKSQIPFGPFIAAGFIVVLLTGISVF